MELLPVTFIPSAYSEWLLVFFDGRSFVVMSCISAGPLVKPSYKLNKFLLQTGFHLSQARQIRIPPYGSLVSVLSRYVVM